MSTDTTTKGSVAILGLGIMGKSMVKTFSKAGYSVHGWNRSEKNRTLVEEMSLPNVIVYSDLEEAVKACDIVIMNVVGDADLETATNLCNSIPPETWKGKILVQYTSHEPTAIKEHEKVLKSYGAIVIGGAMMATGESIGTDNAVFFHSVNRSDASAAEAIDEVEPILKELGPFVAYKEDVGLASLADIAMIQTLFFGMAGHEVAMLLMKRYGASDEFVKSYMDVGTSVVPATLIHEMRTSCDAIMNDDYVKQGNDEFSAGAMIAVLDMHQAFMTKMGLVNDTFAAGHRKYIGKVPAKLGSSKVVDLYVKDIN